MMGEYKFIHTKQIETLAGGDNEFLMELVDIFLEQIPEFVSNMRNSFDSQNWSILAREAHTAKSSVMTFGMDETGTLLKSIQVTIEANDLQKVPEMLHKAIQDMEAAIPELHDFKNTLV